MPGISVKLPLKKDEVDGLYQMNKELKEVVKQDLRMLVLTIPGERILIPNYGVGLEKYLFELAENVQKLHADIVTRIDEQVQLYMPYIKIEHVDFEYNEQDNPHLIQIRIEYFIEPLGVKDFLSVPSEQESFF